MARITTNKISLLAAKSLFPDLIQYGGENVFLGERVSFNFYCHVVAYKEASIFIGNDVLIGPYVMLNASDHGCRELSRLVREQPRIYGKITIGNDVWLAGHVSVLQGSVIPDKCVIGAGSVVTRHDKLEIGGIYVGAGPLRKVGQRK